MHSSELLNSNFPRNHEAGWDHSCVTVVCGCVLDSYGLHTPISNNASCIHYMSSETF